MVGARANSGRYDIASFEKKRYQMCSVRTAVIQNSFDIILWLVLEGV